MSQNSYLSTVKKLPIIIFVISVYSILIIPILFGYDADNLNDMNVFDIVMVFYFCSLISSIFIALDKNICDDLLLLCLILKILLIPIYTLIFLIIIIGILALIAVIGIFMIMAALTMFIFLFILMGIYSTIMAIKIGKKYDFKYTVPFIITQWIPFIDVIAMIVYYIKFKQIRRHIPLEQN